MDRKTPIDRRVVSNFVDQQFLYRVQVRVTEPLYKPGKVWGTCDEGGSITLTHQTFAWPDAIECFGNFCASPRAYPVPCYYEDELEYVGLYHADNVYENGGDRVGVGEQFGMFVPQEFQGYRYPPGGHGRDWYGIGPDGEPSHWQDK